MSNKNAKVIIPLALAAWAGGIVATQVDTPAVSAAFVIVLAVLIPTAVFYLMAEQGWSTLATRFRSSSERYKGRWRPLPTGSVSLVSVDDPAYAKQRLRLVSMLRVATDDGGLHLSLLLSKLPVFGLFFPDLRIPWTQVSAARRYEAPGWVAPMSEPGALLQASYDPNYRGTFVELTCGQPPVFLQLPASVFGEYAARLPSA